MHPMAQTHRQTDGHGDSMTNSAQRGQVGEKVLAFFQFLVGDTNISDIFYKIQNLN